MSTPPMRIVPSMRTPSTRSFMRFRHRSSVDLPHPDGPMYAVTRCLGTSIVTSVRARLAPYQRLRPSISTIGVSTTEAGLAAGFRVALSWMGWAMGCPSYRRRRVGATQALTQGDREQVETDDDDEQEQRGG